MAKTNKALIWSLFAAGGLLTAFVLPVMIFITGIAIPLEILPSEVLSYSRVLAFAQSWLGKGILFVVIFFSIWHAAHRLFITCHDLGISKPKWLIKFLCYGTAWGISILIVFYLFKI